ncbi:enoyl-CoA hydratase-related protein [Kitasatospora sp. NPDC090091]|uniref:enoyl-CoA hydratase-related protein n=1 Tax=Kitasatospora sp. NPDC090091 TaxID=3364081 RepID=UPI003803551D
MTGYETILVERRDRVGVITLDRPKALNAVNTLLVGEVVFVVKKFDCDPETGCLVVTGSAESLAVVGRPAVGGERRPRKARLRPTVM